MEQRSGPTNHSVMGCTAIRQLGRTGSLIEAGIGHQTASDRFKRRLAAIANVQLPKDAASVSLHRVLAKAQLVGYGTSRCSRRNQLQYLDLSWCKVRLVSRLKLLCPGA